jgi:hypothetical protein
MLIVVTVSLVRKNSLVKSMPKLNIKVLFTIVFVVSISLCLYRWQYGSAIKQSAKLSSRIDITSSASLSAMSTSIAYSNDTNWAGYIATSDLQNPQATVTSVSASWTVPAVTISSQDTFSAVWIGIGGFFDKTLIQTGTEQDSIQGFSEYSAWLELLPQNSITIDNITISPGDQIKASIQLVDANTDQWSISLEDLTENQQYTGSFFYASSQLSAEWIVERPELTTRRSRGTLTSLADVGTVEFASCSTTVGGEIGTIGAFPAVQSIMYETVQPLTGSGSTQLAAVSDLTDNGSGFIVETSPSDIPELSVLMMLPLVIGIGLFVTINETRRHARHNHRDP